MNMNRLRIAAAAALIAASCSALAQNYPARTIRMVIPFAPGGNTDIIGRIFVPKMAEIIGQQIIIDNRGGAGSMIGTEAVMRAAPDGYTLLLASAAHTINPSMVKKLPYDSIKDFTPLGVVADVPTAFVLHPSLPPKNVKEFVALAKARPNDIFYSTAGVGTAQPATNTVAPRPKPSPCSISRRDMPRPVAVTVDVAVRSCRAISPPPLCHRPVHAAQSA